MDSADWRCISDCAKTIAKSILELGRSIERAAILQRSGDISCAEAYIRLLNLEREDK